MPLNASIAQGVRPVQIEPQSNALMRALQIVGAQRQNALAEAQMGEQQSAMREREGLRNMLGSPGFDQSSEAGQQQLMRTPGGMEHLKGLYELQGKKASVRSSNATAGKAEEETRAARWMRGLQLLPTIQHPDQAQAWLDAAQTNDFLPPQAVAALKQSLQEDPSQLPLFVQRMQETGLSLLDQVKRREPDLKSVPTGDVTQIVDMNPRTGGGPAVLPHVNVNQPFSVGPDGQTPVPNLPYQAHKKAVAKAGATNIGMPKIEVKTGESLAKEVGGMLKDSKIQAQGAVKMYDAADRIERALDGNAVTAGPGAGAVQTVRQFVQMVGGGDDTKIRAAHQVIRGLATMSVEARKQLQGQGQVTENEAKAVAKADGGDINELTTGELRDLVALTRRAAAFSAQGHQQMLETAGAGQGTAALVPYFKVNGLEALLQHKSDLPAIGGAALPRMKSVEEAKRLPIGTRFLDPSGTERIR